MPPHNGKIFYRKLDELLSRIEMSGERSELLTEVINEVLELFGEDLCILNGRLYEVEGNELVLRLNMKSRGNAREGTRIPIDYPPVKLLFKHRCYIFDSTTPGIDKEFENTVIGGTDSAAIIVGRERLAVLAFGLAEGWEREVLELSLNTIRHALNHRFETEGIRADMSETRLIQRSLFPERIPEFAGYEIAAKSISAEDVGGDFYDLLTPDEDILGIALGDASGHGLPAALLVRDVVTGLRMGVEMQTKITPTIEKLNRVIHQSTVSTKFVSLFYGELESNGNLMYINAGHIPPFLLVNRGMRRLEVGGSILGPLPEIKFKRGFVHFDKGGVFVLLSDGILERLSPAGVDFGEEPVQAIIEEYRERSAQEILDKILTAAKNHGVGRWEDDATVMVIRRLN